MKTEFFNIRIDELTAFKAACEKGTCDFIKYEDGQAHVSYRYDATLFYLGQMFQLEKRHLELVSK